MFIKSLPLSRRYELPLLGYLGCKTGKHVDPGFLGSRTHAFSRARAVQKEYVASQRDRNCHSQRCPYVGGQETRAYFGMQECRVGPMKLHLKAMCLGRQDLLHLLKETKDSLWVWPFIPVPFPFRVGAVISTIYTPTRSILPLALSLPPVVQTSWKLAMQKRAQPERVKSVQFLSSKGEVQGF